VKLQKYGNSSIFQSIHSFDIFNDNILCLLCVDKINLHSDHAASNEGGDKSLVDDQVR